MSDMAETDETLTLSGQMLVAGEWRCGPGETARSLNAQTGDPLDPGFGSAGAQEVVDACAAAAADFDAYRGIDHAARADFLDAIARQIEDLGEALIERTMAETGLPHARLEGERGRTCGQLRLFADLLRSGEGFRVRHDPALPEREPAPRPELKLRHIPIGPVAVFGASNFPLAFSVAGGDTASALAAGCPVVVKAHPAHLGTSELIARAIDKARIACNMPVGVFSLLIGADRELGIALVTDPRICAVGFTGSQSGGLALMAAAAARDVPIPVYAEMSSINPVILFPGAIAERADAIASQFAASLNLGAGQFCTNPGLVFVISGPNADRFMDHAAREVAALPSQTMLTPAICASYREGLARHRSFARLLAEGDREGGANAGRPALFVTDAATFDATSQLTEEIFGPASLIVQCADLAELRNSIEKLEGQLTIAIHVSDEDADAAGTLMPILERKAGRILANGFGTGVEVAHAMVHGGPFPATSDGRSTSVGTLAIDRFLRPLCYQNIPSDILGWGCEVNR